MYKNDTLQFLENLNRIGWRFGLENIYSLLSEMGQPHRNLKSVHIAGTNGKGSTAAMLESIARHAGYKTGLFTSPHLIHVTERIKVNAIPISIASLRSYLSQIMECVERIGCTYFEVLTAVAFKFFADSKVDIAFIEVGLGGRLDATNVLTPLVSIITDIDLDHTEYLGQTKVEIAEEKAGIIKSNRVCLSGSDSDLVNAVLKKVADARNATFHKVQDLCCWHAKNLNENFSEFDLTYGDQKYPDLKIKLTGKHQLRNASLAVVATKTLTGQNFVISKEHIYAGLRDAYWPGRLELLQTSPKIILDVAHNLGAMRSTIHALQSIYEYDRLIILIGLLRDKNCKAISKLIASLADFVCVVSPNARRSLSAQQLGEIVANYTDDFVVCPEFNQGIGLVRSRSRSYDAILVTGSHYTVGQFLQLYQKFFQKKS